MLIEIHHRFVSFLLRVAHDKSLRQSGVDTPSEPAEALLMTQVEQLAAQIIKIKEEDSAEESKGGARAGGIVNGPVRMMRASQSAAAMRAEISHPGVNF